MSTLGNQIPMEARTTLLRMRRLALAFHGSEQRLQVRDERGAPVVRATRTRRQTTKVGSQA